jgi:hypothetical protein
MGAVPEFDEPPGCGIGAVFCERETTDVAYTVSPVYKTWRLAEEGMGGLVA